MLGSDEEDARDPYLDRMKKEGKERADDEEGGQNDDDSDQDGRFMIIIIIIIIIIYNNNGIMACHTPQRVACEFHRISYDLFN